MGESHPLDQLNQRAKSGGGIGGNPSIHVPLSAAVAPWCLAAVARYLFPAVLSFQMTNAVAKKTLDRTLNSLLPALNRKRAFRSTDQTEEADSDTGLTSPEGDGHPQLSSNPSSAPSQWPTTERCPVRISLQFSIFWRTACARIDIWHRSRSTRRRPR